jgi:hypothetical protein
MIRKTVIARSEATAAILIVALFLAGCVTKTTTFKAPTKLVVKAVKVNSAPTLDGRGNDAVWKQASPTLIPTQNGLGATMQAVYTDTMIYFLVKWRDATPKDGRLWWVYDGAKWTSTLEQDDKLAFLWNMNHSIKDFDKTGCQAVCHAGPEGRDEMAIFGASSPDKIWPGYKQMADAWKWAPGVMQEKHVVDDGLFSAGQAALANPELQRQFELSLLFDGGDAGTKQWWTRNPNAGESLGGGSGYKDEADEAPGSFRPAYAPRPGFDLNKHPFPNMRDMVPITDYSTFKPGDKLPMIVYFDLTTEKNKMDFPQGKPSGSRVDLSGQGTYDKAALAYTLEFGRALDTKHNDDVQFHPSPNKAVAENVFGLAVFDDTRFNHSVSEPVTLVLEP